jgi:hypothetical protein
MKEGYANHLQWGGRGLRRMRFEVSHQHVLDEVRRFPAHFTMKL